MPCCGIVTLAVFGGICSRLEASNCLIFLLAIFEGAAGSTSKMRERDNAAGEGFQVSPRVPHSGNCSNLTCAALPVAGDASAVFMYGVVDLMFAA
jgi:hypothetical protein